MPIVEFVRLRLTNPARDRRKPRSRLPTSRKFVPSQGKASDATRRIPAVYVIVLGIDPGVANTGYGVVAQHQGRMLALDGGVVETSPGLDAGRRLAVIHERVGELLDEYRPDALALEDVYFGANARSAFGVGQARGVV